MTTVPKFNLTYDGVVYEAEHARCESFTLTREDHGIFTAFIQFSAAGWGQGLPAYGLDKPDPDGSKDYRDRERLGTAFGATFIMEAVRVLGTPAEKMDVPVVVLRTGHMIEGFARVSTDGTIGKPFLVSRIKALHEDELART